MTYFDAFVKFLNAPSFDFPFKNTFCNCNESSFLISHFKVFNYAKYSSYNSSVLGFRRDEFKALGM